MKARRKTRVVTHTADWTSCIASTALHILYETEYRYIGQRRRAHEGAGRPPPSREGENTTFIGRNKSLLGVGLLVRKTIGSCRRPGTTVDQGLLLHWVRAGQGRLGGLHDRSCRLLQNPVFIYACSIKAWIHLFVVESCGFPLFWLTGTIDKFSI